MKSNLAKALAQLELKSQLNINYVDNKLLTASSIILSKDGSNPSNVLDDNPATMWHTDWNITTLPHWIALESQTPISINGLTYVPRQTGTNGNVTSYAIEVSDDGNDWRVIKEGKLPSDSSTKIIGFDEVTTTHVRLVYREA
ncbi:discoidin domain-containing protein [Coprobacillaceae bacterium CR2/5/TPMF4]|nr:discoidin domain-containing protein [Coprobacillaceae bacterium CR2/5/TPMF4]